MKTESHMWIIFKESYNASYLFRKMYIYFCLTMIPIVLLYLSLTDTPWYGLIAPSMLFVLVTLVYYSKLVQVFRLEDD
jgi:hypothetical protein